jgi:transcription antitermination factor NusG
MPDIEVEHIALIATKKQLMGEIMLVRFAILLVMLCGCGRPFMASPPMITETELNRMKLPLQLGNQVHVVAGPHKGQTGSIEGVSGFTGEIFYIVKMGNSTSAFTAETLSNIKTGD